MDKYHFIDRKYGKYWVKLLHVNREGDKHSIREYEVNTLLTLDSDKDYTHVRNFLVKRKLTNPDLVILQGDNSDIIATDSQKNTVYLLAKKHGVDNPERFAILIAKHFLQTYSWVNRAEITVEALNWERVRDDHVHAFVAIPKYTRWAQVVMKRNWTAPKVTAGLKGLRLLKTTKSGFVNFVQDGYRSLPDQKDRIMSTIVEAKWTYGNIEGLYFCRAFNEVEKALVDNFAGPNATGLFSASVQKTVFDTQVYLIGNDHQDYNFLTFLL